MSTPTVSPCADDAFYVDGVGELRVRGPAQNPWPLAAPMRMANGLHVDPANGLWTAPHGLYRRFFSNANSGMSTTVTPSAPWKNTTSSTGALTPLTFTNPSYCQPMAVFAWCESRVLATLQAAVGTTVVAQHRAQMVWQQPATTTAPANISPNVVGQIMAPAQATASTPGWFDHRRLPGQYTPHGSLVPPGGTIAWWVFQELWSLSGNITLTGWYVQVMIECVLLDLSQVGDVT